MNVKQYIQLLDVKIERLLLQLRERDIPNLGDESSLKKLQREILLVKSEIEAYREKRGFDNNFQGTTTQSNWIEIMKLSTLIDIKLEDISNEQQQNHDISDQQAQAKSDTPKEEYDERVKEFQQRTRETLRKRTDDAGVNFRRFVTGINSGGIIVSLYICKTLLENKIDPIEKLIIVPIVIFFCGLLVTGASNYLQKWKRSKDEEVFEIYNTTFDWKKPYRVEKLYQNEY